MALIIPGDHMIHAIIPPEDVEKINTQRFLCDDPIISRRLHVLFLKSLNVPHHLICEYVDITPPALIKVIRNYIRGGLEEVMRLNWKPRHAVLDDHREIIEKHFREYPPESVAAARVEIEKLTGIKRGNTQIRNFLLKIGMKSRKVAGIPSKADPEEQEEFKKKVWNQP
jgi:transposase